MTKAHDGENTLSIKSITVWLYLFVLKAYFIAFIIPRQNPFLSPPNKYSDTQTDSYPLHLSLELELLPDSLYRIHEQNSLHATGLSHRKGLDTVWARQILDLLSHNSLPSASGPALRSSSMDLGSNRTAPQPWPCPSSTPGSCSEDGR